MSMNFDQHAQELRKWATSINAPPNAKIYSWRKLKASLGSHRVKNFLHYERQSQKSVPQCPVGTSALLSQAQKEALPGLRASNYKAISG